MLEGRRKGVQLALYIVDADASVRESLGRIAAADGFQVRGFASIEQFVTDLEHTGKGCVLLDSSLVRNGSALREAMRRRSFEWPVVVLCAGVDQAARREARELRADLMLNKPVDARMLIDTIAWVIDEEM
jgi:FixJ family two-component response regulator